MPLRVTINIMYFLNDETFNVGLKTDFETFLDHSEKSREV